MSGPTARIRLLPPEQCYWAVVTAPAGSRDPEAIGYACEALLPVPVDQLRLAVTALPERGRFLCCGHPREQIEAIRSEAAPPWSLRPAALPPHYADAYPETLCARLELLAGTDEAPAPRRWRRRAVGIGVLGILLAAALLLQHQLAQATAWRQLAAQREQQALSALTGALPQAAGNPASLHAQLTMAMRRLDGQVQVASGPDAALLLDALLRAWPQDARLRLERLDITAERILLRGQAPDLDSAEALRTACAQLRLPEQVWRAQPLQAQQSPDGIRFSFSLEPTKPEAP
ncbi:MAG: hypothetical protein ACOCXJ_09720 [Planctomycetota bacterium]